MTMLDRMRRHQSWLKWSLGIVVVTFVLLYVPQFLAPTGTGAAGSDVVASVDGRRITANTFQMEYARQLQQIQANAGSAMTPDLLRQLQIGPRLLQDMVSREAIVLEAQRLGLSVTDGELRERLVRIPGFQQNGQFIGEQQYKQLLQQARPPLRPADFEAELRNDLLREKLRAALTDWVRVSDADVDAEFLKRNEKIQLELAVFSANQFQAGIVPTDADLAAEFETHADRYRIPEKRRVSYIMVDAAALRDTMTATAQEVQARYQRNIAMYSTPEQVRASHILFSTEGKDEAAVRKTAEGVLARAKSGADFAALAKQYSDDPQSKENGGDLDYFSRGTMVAEFDQVAWSLQPNEISDLVKTPFGFHIIKVTDHRAATTRTLDEVRPQLEEQVKAEKAQAEATRLAGELAGEIKTPADLERVAAARKLAVGDSGLFARDEPLAGLGFAPNVAAEAFRLEVDKVSGQILSGQGYAFIALKEVVPPAMPQLADVRDRVRQAVVEAKSVERAASKAKEMADAAAKSSFAAAARAAGVTVKSTDFVTRGSVLPEVGVSPKVDDVVFKLAKGETSGPIETDTAVVVARVKDRQEIDAATRDAGREALRTELVQTRAQSFFQAYMTKAMEKMTITYNQETLDKIVGN